MSIKHRHALIAAGFNVERDPEGGFIAEESPSVFHARGLPAPATPCHIWAPTLRELAEIVPAPPYPRIICSD